MKISYVVKLLVSALFSLVVLLGAGVALADTGNYSDSASIPDWAQADVALTSQFRVFRGDASGTFRPNADISRAEFTAILMRAFSLRPDPTVAVPFTDISGGWYTDVITLAVQTGVIRAGDFPTQFGPNQPINRAQMARMVARAVDARHVIFTPGETLTFSDVPSSDPFYEAITKATSYGIIRGMGDGTFAPAQTATRAQAAVMIARAMRLGQPLEPDVNAGATYKGVMTGVSNVFLGATELAAVRSPGTSADFSSLSVWLTPEAQAKLSTVLNRDIPAGQVVGYSWWEDQGVTFTGEDHAILHGRVIGVNGNIDLPVQRHLDGRWKILDIPFTSFDPSQMARGESTTITYSYTDVTGTLYNMEYSAGNVEGFFRFLSNRNWGNGTVRILRIGGRNWDQTSYRDTVTALHAQLDGQRTVPEHYMVLQESGLPTVRTMPSDTELAVQVAASVLDIPLIVSVDGTPWEHIAEAPYFRELVQAAGTTMNLDDVVQADPGRWVTAFHNMLGEARNSPQAFR